MSNDILDEQERSEVQMTVASIRGLIAADDRVSPLQEMVVRLWDHSESLSRRNLVLANQRLKIEKGAELLMNRAWTEGYDASGKGQQRHSPYAPSKRN